MLSRTDLSRLVMEAGPALAGSVVHRIWRRDDDTYVILARFEDRPEPFPRIALGIALAPEGARVAALPAEDVAADDPEAKKARKDDTHFFLAALRKALPGGRITALAAVTGERIALLDVER